MSQPRNLSLFVIACLVVVCPSAHAASDSSVEYSSGLAKRLLERDPKIVVLLSGGREIIDGFHESPLGECWNDPSNSGLRTMVEQMAAQRLMTMFDLSLTDFQELLGGRVAFYAVSCDWCSSHLWWSELVCGRCRYPSRLGSSRRLRWSRSCPGSRRWS